LSAQNQNERKFQILCLQNTEKRNKVKVLPMMLHLNGHTMGFWSRTQKLKLALHVSITESKLADLMHKQEHHNNKIDKDTHGAIYRQIFAVIAWQVSFKLSLKTQVVQHKGSTSEKKYLN